MSREMSREMSRVDNSDVEQLPQQYFGEDENGEYLGTLYTPQEERCAHDEEEYTIHSSMERPAQTLNLNGISGTEFFFEWPCLSHIVFENNTSEARDLDANERNFLSMLRLTLYLGLVGSVVLFNYRLPTEGSSSPDNDSSDKKIQLSEKVSFPLGIVFCILAILGLFATLKNYISTIGGYAKQRSVVNTTPEAQLLVLASGATIFAANVIFLMYN